MGQVWYLIVSIPDLCTLTYFQIDLKVKNLPINTKALKTWLPEEKRTIFKENLDYIYIYIKYFSKYYTNEPNHSFTW